MEEPVDPAEWKLQSSDRGTVNTIAALDRKERATLVLSLAKAKLFLHKTGGGRLLPGNRGVAQPGGLIWPEAQLDDGSGVWNQLGLPAIIGLELLHRCLRLGIPVTGGFTRKITGLDERGLNLGGAGVVDRALAGGL